MKRKLGSKTKKTENGKPVKETLKKEKSVVNNSNEDSDLVDDTEEPFDSEENDIEGDCSSQDEQVDDCGVNSKKRKLNYKKDLYKAPTSQEISALRETENLYNCNLFRLQVEELLKEVKLKPKNSLDSFLKTLRTFLLEITEDSEIYKLNDEEWINDTGYKLPFEKLPDDDKGRFKFSPPTKVEVLGGYPLGLSCKSNVVIDVGVEIPKTFFDKGDNLNYRYHRKRAMYLLRLTHELRSFDDVDEMRFSHFNGDQHKPCLLIKPLGNLSKKYTICIYPYSPNSIFKINKLIPIRNNVRSTWYFEAGQATEDLPTPVYNSSILHDMFFEQNWKVLKNLIGSSNSIRDSIILLKVWTHQRELDKGFGAVGSFLLSMFVGYLLKLKKLNGLMSSYQIVRTTWLHLSSSKWDSEGISLCDDQQNLALNNFTSAFEVVFVDSSGYLNLCANMSTITYLRLKQEAELAVKCLDTSESGSFDSLFMTPVPFVRKFDHFITLDSKDLSQAYKKFDLSLLDYGDQRNRKMISKIFEYLQSGLSKRIQQIDLQLIGPLIWDLTEDFSNVCSTSFTFGLLLDLNFSGSFVEKGPPADSTDALKFREFWGEKSDLRRFQDGSICEAVVWPGSTIADKRSVCKHIVTYTLTRHFCLPEFGICYLGTEFENQINLNRAHSNMAAEEQMISVINTLEALGKDLRKLDLELTINSVKGISPIFRYTEVYPPEIYTSKVNLVEYEMGDEYLLLKSNQEKAPLWLRPLEVILQLETSSKWPEDLAAIRHLKAAFHIRLGENLKQHKNLACFACVDYCDVLKDGYVFRLIVSTTREIVAMKASTSLTGVTKFQDTDESLLLEMKTDHLPKLTSALHGLQMQHSAFSVVCRLAKRWMYSQLLWDHINDVTIDLMVASLFTDSAPFTLPNCSQAGFVRFLQLLHSFDWKNSPLIVNFNNELKKEDISEIQSMFTSSRSQLPDMFIATPYDKFQSSWTKQKPIPQITYRIKCLAKVAQQIVETQILNQKSNFDYKTIFRPSLEPYDVIIHLNSSQVPSAGLAIDNTIRESPAKSWTIPDKGLTPVIDYNPVLCYLKELKEMFGDMALFFYDYFGGMYIAVLWKPTSFQYQPFKVSNISGKMIAGDSTRKPVMVTPNTGAILEEFANIGQGLIKSITTKSQNWTYMS